MKTKTSNYITLNILCRGILLAALGITSVWGNTLTVNDLGGGITAADGLCTLPEAINNAEANNDTTSGDCVAGSGADIIKFNVNGNVLSGALPVINDPKGLTIDGSGQTVTLGNGASASNGAGFFTLRSGSILHLKKLTVFNASGDETGGAMYNSGGTVTISNCTFSENFARHAGGIMNSGTLTIANSLFTKNRASRSAGAIENGGKLTITDSTFSNNGANSATHESQGGGAIDNGGSITIVNSTFSNNFARFGGGGGIKSRGNVTLISSTFTNNFSAGEMTFGGGGIYCGEHSKLTVINSTFSGNGSALTNLGGGGGAIHHEGDSIKVFNSTFSGNWSILGIKPGFAGVGGILFKGKGISQLANNILADNKGGDCQSSGTLTTNLNNLIKDGSCNPALSGNPKLGPLTNNGGPTQTFALLTGSPALDAGNDAICKSAPANGRDQRGVIRPQGAHCDIGAFEAAFADLSLAIIDTPDPVEVHNRLTWTITVTNSGVAKATGVTLTDKLPTTGYKFISTTLSQGKCNTPTFAGNITCNLGSLANGKRAIVKIVVKPTGIGKISNTAKVISNQFDNYLANNSTTQITTVKPRF